MEDFTTWKARHEKRHEMYRLELEIIQRDPEFGKIDLRVAMDRAYRRTLNRYPVHLGDKQELPR